MSQIVESAEHPPPAISASMATASNAISSDQAVHSRNIPPDQEPMQKHKPRHHQTSPFFSLPAELRNRIYQLINFPSGYATPSETNFSKNHPVTIDRLFTQPGYKLTQISTQIRAEASPVFFSCNTFKFYLCFAPPLWLYRVEAKYLAFISFIVLEDYQSEGWHPTPVCQSRIEIDLAKLREGGGDEVGRDGESVEEEEQQQQQQRVVVKHTDRKCEQCERRRHVRPTKLEGIVRAMRVAGEGEEKQNPKLSREGLLALFDAARFNYGEESRLAGIEERVID